MKILMINSVSGIRSTGRICTDIAEGMIAEGHEVKIAYGREDVPEKYRPLAVRIGSKRSERVNALKSRLFDNEGFNCKRTTKRFLRWAEQYDPDLLWLHNLHGYYLNLKLLFDWIKSRPSMKVKWTLHDCWAFTGHCSHFITAGCDKWQTHCDACPQKKGYPTSVLLSRARRNFDRKRECFLGVKDMTLITPSHWLANLARQSFLKDYPIEVVHNKINTEVFRPTPSDFRERYGLTDRRIVLGVATAWSASKGLSDFVRLSELLPDVYRIVLVGITPETAKTLPERILTIPRTNNATELAEIYTAADVFVNPSRQETFGLTTLEAISCGTPAIVYSGTACEEVVNTYGGGVAVSPSADAILVEIEKIFK